MTDQISNTQETTQEAPTSNLEKTIMAGTEPTENTSTDTQTSEPSLFEQTQDDMNAESRPEWLPEKFKTGEDLSKSYSELSNKLGAHVGAPEEYAMELGEGLEDFAISLDDPFAADFANILKESGVNQETYTKIANQYFSKLKVDAESKEYAQNEKFKQDVKEVGDAGLQDIKDSISWLKGEVTEDTFNMLREMGENNLDIGKMINQFHNTYENKNYVESPVTSEKILSDIDKGLEAKNMMADSRYGTDPQWTKATDLRYKELYG